MRRRPLHLINTTEIELWPAQLLRARSNRDARILSQACWVLRRKRDGRFLAADVPAGLLPLVVRLAQEPGLADALAALACAKPLSAHGLPALTTLPLAGLQRYLQQLGVDDRYAEHYQLPQVAEPGQLHYAGCDRYRRPLWLLAPAARAWQRLRTAAWQENIILEAISGYRSHRYQMGIFERKLARGLSVAQILAVNAAPGYSEHHSGCALDIGTPSEPPAEITFESTDAFAWLSQHANRFGFHLSYPRNNPHGIVYEPWHWRWQPATAT